MSIKRDRPVISVMQKGRITLWTKSLNCIICRVSFDDVPRTETSHAISNVDETVHATLTVSIGLYAKPVDTESALQQACPRVVCTIICLHLSSWEVSWWWILMLESQAGDDIMKYGDTASAKLEVWAGNDMVELDCTKSCLPAVPYFTALSYQRTSWLSLKHCAVHSCVSRLEEMRVNQSHPLSIHSRGYLRAKLNLSREDKSGPSVATCIFVYRGDLKSITAILSLAKSAQWCALPQFKYIFPFEKLRDNTCWNFWTIVWDSVLVINVKPFDSNKTRTCSKQRAVCKDYGVSV